MPGRVIVFVLATACAGSGSRSQPDASAEAVLDDDLRMLCGRIRARNVSAWSQPVYRTQQLADLTIRIDGGDEDARCELGRLMQRRRVAACRETASTLRKSC